jgi:hypothetical protein
MVEMPGIGYYVEGDGTKTPPKCSSLSPPLAKASAELNWFGGSIF